jgi:hypothetical protein
LKRLSNLLNDFEQVRSKQLGSADLTDVAQAMIAGRFGKLLVEADRQIPGKRDAASGRVELGELAHQDVGDLLDDFAEITVEMGGEVVVVPAERMPTATVYCACLHDHRMCSLGKVHRQAAKRYSHAQPG